MNEGLFYGFFFGLLFMFIGAPIGARWLERVREPDIIELGLASISRDLEEKERLAAVEAEANSLRQVVKKHEEDKAAEERRLRTPPKVSITPSRWRDSVTISMRSLNGIGFSYNWVVTKYNHRHEDSLARSTSSFSPDRIGHTLSVRLALSRIMMSLMVEELVLIFDCESLHIKDIPNSEQQQHRKSCVFRLRWHPRKEKIEIFTEAGVPVETLEALTQIEHKATNPPTRVPLILPSTKAMLACPKE